MGVPSDPVKVQRMRSLERARTACVADPQCASWGGDGGAALRNFSRFFLKNSEHSKMLSRFVVADASLTWEVSLLQLGA